MHLELKIRYGGGGKSRQRELVPDTAKRDGGGGTKRTGRTESEGGEKREETNQTRNSKLLFNFFFIDKLLSKLILALTCAQNPQPHTHQNYGIYATDKCSPG